LRRVSGGVGPGGVAALERELKPGAGMLCGVQAASAQLNQPVSIVAVEMLVQAAGLSIRMDCPHRGGSST